MKLIITLVSLVALTCEVSTAQLLHWAKKYEKNSALSSNALCIDSFGNCCVTGYFTTTVDFDPGPGVYNLTSVYGPDAFVTKLDSAGNFLWARRFVGYNVCSGSDIAVDQSGNVYVIGKFEASMAVYVDSTSYGLASFGGGDIFVVKLNADGEYVWGHGFGGPEIDYGTALAIDESGNLFIAGSFSDTVDFDPTAADYSISTMSTWWRGGFVCKYDTAFNPIWCKQISGTGNFTISDIALHHDTVYLAGQFYHTIDFDPDTGQASVDGGYPGHGYVCKWDPDGQFVWVSQVIEGGCKALDIHESGNIYTTGYFHNGGDINNFIAARCAPNGNIDWLYSLENCFTFVSVYNQGSAIAVTDTGVYITGHVQNSSCVDFLPGASEFLFSPVFKGAFILKFDTAGQLQWVETFDGGSDDGGTSLALSQNGTIYATGFFSSGDIDFDPGLDTFILSVPFLGIYVMKFTEDPCTYDVVVETDSILPVTCTTAGFAQVSLENWNGPYSYSWSTGADDTVSYNTFIAPGTYSVTVSGANGCERRADVTFDTLPNLNTEITQTGNTLNAANGGDAYQWIDCASGQPIAGETGLTFSTLIDGSYAYTVIKGICSDTSACLDFIHTGLHELTGQQQLIVYPNPAHDRIFVVVPDAYSRGALELSNVLGETIAHFQMDENTEQLPLPATPGVYLIKLTSPNGATLSKTIAKE